MILWIGRFFFPYKLTWINIANNINTLTSFCPFWSQGAGTYNVCWGPFDQYLPKLWPFIKHTPLVQFFISKNVSLGSSSIVNVPRYKAGLLGWFSGRALHRPPFILMNCGKKRTQCAYHFSELTHWTGKSANVVLPNWELFLAKLTLVLKDDQFTHEQLPQFGRTDPLYLQTDWSDLSVLTNSKCLLVWTTYTILHV